MNEEKIIAPKPRRGYQRPLAAEEKAHNAALREAHGYKGKYAIVKGGKIVAYANRYADAQSIAGWTVDMIGKPEEVTIAERIREWSDRKLCYAGYLAEEA